MTTTWIGAVMKNFDVPHNASGIIRVPCKLCQTYISGTSSSAGNFLKHIKRKHVDLYLSLINVKYKFDLSGKSNRSQNASKNSNSQLEDSESNESSPRKCVNYTQEFKLKVLEYYFSNGGENKFGLKSKTAQHFQIDKKTINRMLCNPEMVKRACKAINQKSVLGESKHSSRYGLPSRSTDSNKTGTQNSCIIDLPEDPDFSVLKQAISSHASGIGSITRLLLTGTKEIQKIILEECDIIFECKVCKNLFRSVVNFLAHKRIYCSEQYVNAQNIFHKDDCEGRTTESNTVIVEPEPPDGYVQTEGPKIDQIASKLASKNTNMLSSSINKGSSKYYDMIEKTQGIRSELRKDCSVILKNVANTNKALFQDYIRHGESPPVEGTKELVRQAIENRMGVTAILDEDGKIIGTEPGTPSDIDMTRFKNNNSYLDPSPIDSPCDSPSVEENETDESDSYERIIYTCPICNALFLSMGGCNKHLLKVHKKKKHQRDRLRQVIASRTYKKTFTKEGLKNYHLKSDSKNSNSSSEENKTHKLTESKNRSENDVQQTKEESKPKLQNLCIRCKKTFLTGGALGSHIKYCQFQPIKPKLPNEQPEKKIAIQIRKDYNKKDYVVTNLSTRESPTKIITEQQKRILEEIEEKTKLLRSAGKYNCIPCKRKFPKRSSLHYHMAKHLNYNRFKCLNCDFRSYHRYTIARHCESSHTFPNCFTEEDRLGEFVYYLDDISLTASGATMDDDYKKLLNSVQPVKIEDIDLTHEVNVIETKDKVDEHSDDEKIIGHDIDPLAIDDPVKSEDVIETVVLEESVDLSVKVDRPQRQRRSIERKDFIYEIKLPQIIKPAEEDGTKENKRKGSPVEDLTRKKFVKTEDNLCNGKSSPKSHSADGTAEEINSATVNTALDKCLHAPVISAPSTE